MSMIGFKTQKLLEGYLLYLKTQKRYSNHTITAYNKDILQLLSFVSLVLDDVLVENIKFIHIRSWIVELSENGISNRSINRKVTSIRSFYKFLRKANPTLTNPCDRVMALKIPKRLPAIVKEKELLNLWDAVFTKEKEDFFQWRDFTMIEVLYNTGIRRSELIGITMSDLNMNKGLLRVFGKGKKERLIPLSPSLIKTLHSYISWRTDLEQVETNSLFITDNFKQLYPKAVYNIVKKYLSLITTIEKRSPHSLRHSFATHLTNRGAELNAVKELLGHSSLAATQVYTHNSIEQLKNIYQKAHPKGE